MHTECELQGWLWALIPHSPGKRSSKPLPSFPLLSATTPRMGTAGTTHRGSGWLSPQTHTNTDTGRPWGWGGQVEVWAGRHKPEQQLPSEGVLGAGQTSPR